MKKLFVMVMAMAAISFVSCSDSTDGNTSSEDSITCECDSCATLDGDEDPAEVMVATLTEQIKSGDAVQVTHLLTQATEQIQKLYATGDSVAAEAYASKILALVNENTEKLNEIKVSSTPIITAINTARGVDPEGLVEETKAAVKADGQQAVEAGKAAGKQIVSDAKTAGKQAATEAVDAAAQKATEKATEKINSLLK